MDCENMSCFCYARRCRHRAGNHGFLMQRVVSEGSARRFEVDIVEADGSNLEALQRESLLQEVKSPYLADLLELGEAKGLKKKYGKARLEAACSRTDVVPEPKERRAPLRTPTTPGSAATPVPHSARSSQK